MKVIFLDVDGVLNRGSFDLASGGLHDDCIEQLRQLVLHTGAKIVVSSSWKDAEKLMLQLKCKLYEHGAMRAIDTTEYRSRKLREVEIQEWLDKHPEVENYVVLDDWDLKEFFPGHMVQTCEYHRIGLDDQWRIEAEKILLK